MEKIIIFAVLTVFSMVVTGFYFIYKGTDANRKFARAFLKLNLFVFAPVFVSNVGSAAIGAVSEDPNILGKSMIYLGLAEGIAIYGLIISIMILGRL